MVTNPQITQITQKEWVSTSLYQERGMNILITGAAGFIGSALCSRLASGNKVIGVDITRKPDKSTNIAWEQADLADMADRDLAAAICDKYSPDVVIHCAGIAHQKIGVVDSATYTWAWGTLGLGDVGNL